MNYQRLFRSTLRRQLSVSSILLVVSVLITIGFTSIKITQQVIRNHTARFGGKMLTQAAYRLGSVIDNAEITVASIILDYRLAPLLNDFASSDPNLQEKGRVGLYELLRQYKKSLLPGTELMIITSNRNMVSTYNYQTVSSNVIPEELTDKPKEWQLRYLSSYKSSDLLFSGRLLELKAKIISLPWQKQSGWIVLHLDYRIVESIMTNITLQENSRNRFQSDVVVFGPNNQVIFPWIAPSDQILTRAYQRLSGKLEDTEMIEESIDGEKHLVIATPVPWTSWEMYISAPTKYLYASLEQIYNNIIIIGLICTIIAILGATIISFVITEPIDKLRKVMHLVEEGDFTVRAPESGPLEIKTLGRAFNLMLQEVNLLTKRLVTEEGERKTAMIKALQAQIAPHFLFNTLAAMAGMTAKRPPEEVAAALRSLKRLLYLSIGRDGDFVTLANEFEYIHHYIHLMNIRYPDKLTLKINLPAELENYLTLRLIVQPIVENCLQHGLKWQKGQIDITAYQDDSDIIIDITDNGAGMTPEQISDLWQQDQNRTGIGIRNVDERLKLSYGINYGLTVVSVPEQGTTVSLRIPCQKYADLNYEETKEQVSCGEQY